VAFASLHEGIDTTTSTGRLVFHIFAALAEFERELIAERAAVGRAAAPAAARAAVLPSSPQPRSLWPGRGMRPGTSPWPRSPRRWGSAAAPSTGRSSRRPDRGVRSGRRAAGGLRWTLGDDRAVAVMALGFAARHRVEYDSRQEFARPLEVSLHRCIRACEHLEFVGQACRGRMASGESSADADAALLASHDPGRRRRLHERHPLMSIGFLFLAASAALLIAGAELFAENAAGAGRRLGVSFLAVGLILAGAEPEEFVTAVIAAARHHPAIGAGDAIGANVTMLTLVIGAACLISPMSFGPRLRGYAAAAALTGGGAALALAGGLSRPEGVGLIGLYLVVLAVIWRAERRPPAKPPNSPAIAMLRLAGLRRSRSRWCSPGSS